MALEPKKQGRHLSHPNGAAVHFDDRTALHLTQAFNQEESLTSLLALAHTQLTALCGTDGLRFTHESLDTEFLLGHKAGHSAEYNLHINERDLGQLTLFFRRRQNEQEVQTCEDLLALALSALRNQIDLMNATQAAAQDQRTDEKSLADEEKADALVLVTLDGYRDMKPRDGDEWSQVLMTSVHSQIKEGLRTADGVYQIADDLIAVLLPHTSRKQALEVAHKIRVLVASLHLTGAESVDHQLTASMGISDALLAGTAEQVMANAKVALTAAQDQGTNVIQTYDEGLMLKLGIG